jgi:hypothetical protein
MSLFTLATRSNGRGGLLLAWMKPPGVASLFVELRGPRQIRRTPGPSTLRRSVPSSLKSDIVGSSAPCRGFRRPVATNHRSDLELPK